MIEPDGAMDTILEARTQILNLHGRLRCPLRCTVSGLAAGLADEILRPDEQDEEVASHLGKV